jgi:putative salt-induced outer membrane protein
MVSLRRFSYHAAAELHIERSSMRTLPIVGFFAMSGTAFAQAPAPAPVDPFIANVALGYLSTSGNTESTNANGSFESTWDLDGPWKHDWKALAISARTDDVRTTESYSAAYKAQRDFSATGYLFFSGDWRQDPFAGYDRQISEAVGYGRRLIDNARHMLALEGGGGAKQSDLVTGEELDEAIVRGGLDYLFVISDNSELSQELLLEIGDDNRYTESKTALKTQIVGSIALVFSYVIKSNSDVPVGIEETDRFTALSLEYSF